MALAARFAALQVLGENAGSVSRSLLAA